MRKNPPFFEQENLHQELLEQEQEKAWSKGQITKKKFRDLRILCLALPLLHRAENSKGKLGIGRGPVVHPEHLRDEGTGRV